MGKGAEVEPYVLDHANIAESQKNELDELERAYKAQKLKLLRNIRNALEQAKVARAEAAAATASRTFKALDALLDKDGKVSEAELHDGLELATGRLISVESVAAVFNAIDKNGDGHISEDEFIAAVVQIAEKGHLQPHGFWCGQGGYFSTLANWGGVWYFVGSTFFTISTIRTLAEDSDASELEWHDWLPILGTMGYMAGSVAFIGMAVNFQKEKRKSEKNRILEFFNNLTTPQTTSKLATPAKAESRGPCSRCGELVLVTQEREADGTGAYCHTNAADCSAATTSPGGAAGAPHLKKHVGRNAVHPTHGETEA